MSDAPLLRRYTFKLYPNAGQAEALHAQRRMMAQLYNALLQQRIEAYTRRGETLTYYDQCKEITALRRDPECVEWRGLSSSSMTATAQRLDRAYKAFFRRAKAGAGAQAGFPRFKRSDDYPSIPFKRHRDSWRYDPAHGWRDGRLTVRGVPGTIRVRGKLPCAPIAIKTCEILWREERWWLSLAVAMPKRRRAGRTRLRVTFDLVSEFAREEPLPDDGGLPAGPEGAGSPAPDDGRSGPDDGPQRPSASVSAGADGRVVPDYQGVIATSAAEAPESRGGQGSAQRSTEYPTAAEAPESRGGQGERVTDYPDPVAAEAPESRGGQGLCRLRALGFSAAEAPESRGGQGSTSVAVRARSAAEAPESRGGQGRISASILSISAAEAPESRGGQGSPLARRRRSSAAEAPESRDGQGDFGSLESGRVAAGSPDSEGDEGRASAPSAHRRAADDPAWRVAALQRAMARCRRGSCRYRQLRRRKARLEARVARQRREHLHEWSTDIIRRAAALVVVAPKDLKAATASGRGTLRNPGAEVAFKARFNRRVLSFAPGAAIAMLRYKAAEAGCAFDPREDEAAPADLGNKVVRNVKAVRTAKRLINHKQGKARNGSKPAAS